MASSEVEKLRLENEINRLKAENENMVLRQQIKDLECTNKVTKMESQIDKSNMDSQIEKSKTEMQNEKSKMEMKNEIEILRRENEQLKIALESTGGVEQGESFKVEKERIRKEMEELKKEIEKIKSGAESKGKVESGYEELREELKEMQGEIEGLKSRAKLSEGFKLENDKLKEELHKVKEEIEILKRGTQSPGNNAIINKNFFVTNEMRFIEGVQKFIEGRETKTNLFATYEDYYNTIFEEMKNYLQIAYNKHSQQNNEPYTSENDDPSIMYHFKNYLFVKMEYANHKGIPIQFMTSSSNEENHRIEYQTWFAQNRGSSYATTDINYIRCDKVLNYQHDVKALDDGWSHSGCTVLALHPKDPMKSIELIPKFEKQQTNINYNNKVTIYSAKNISKCHQIWSSNNVTDFNENFPAISRYNPNFYCIICCIRK